MTHYIEQENALEHDELLNQLFDLIHQDFGCPEDIQDERYDPFNPAHIAHLALDMLNGVYKDWEIEQLAQDSLSGHLEQDVQA